MQIRHAAFACFLYAFTVCTSVLSLSLPPVTFSLSLSCSPLYFSLPSFLFLILSLCPPLLCPGEGMGTALTPLAFCGETDNQPNVWWPSGGIFQGDKYTHTHTHTYTHIHTHTFTHTHTHTHIHKLLI